MEETFKASLLSACSSVVAEICLEIIAFRERVHGTCHLAGLGGLSSWQWRMSLFGSSCVCTDSSQSPSLQRVSLPGDRVAQATHHTVGEGLDPESSQ